MARYEPLGHYLRTSGASLVPMTFHDVELLIGRDLPPSAYRHRPWWANEERGHAHAKAWLEAGYQTEQVDMNARTLVFRHVAQPGLHRAERGAAPASAARALHPLLGWMKGTFTFEADATPHSHEIEALLKDLEKSTDLTETGSRK